MTNGVRHRFKRFLIALIGLSLLQPVSVRAVSFTVVVVETSSVAFVTQCDPDAPIQSVIEALDIITLKVPHHQVSSTLQTYRQCPGITAVYADPQTTLTLTPLDPYYTSNNQWNLSAIGAPQAWDLNTGSADIIIAVIDTGITPSDPLSDFNAARLLRGVRIVNGITSVDTTVAQYSYDGGSHGTAVASLIGAQMNNIGIAGLAPGVSILPVKVFRDATYTGERVSAYNSDIAAGILWAVDQGADILNLSLGGPSSDTAMANAIAYALDHNVLIVAASGNDSDNDGSDPNKTDQVEVSYPAAYDGVIAVGSIKSNNTVSDFSNIAGTGILLSAYGEGITLPWLDNDGFYNLSGTSFSAPTVSAVLGLMLSLEPTLSPQAAIAILSGTVTDITSTGYDAGYDVWTGYGHVHAHQALLGVQEYLSYSDTDNTIQTATPLMLDTPITNQLRPALDNDYYTLTLEEPETITITVNVTDLQDPMITLFDADQNVIRFIDDQPNGIPETLSLSLAAGTYTVLVNDFMGRSNPNDYTIDVIVSRHVDVVPPANGTITIQSGDVTVSQSSYLPLGSLLEITATPSPNYRLYRWFLNDADLLHRETAFELTLTQSVTLRAEFGLAGDLNDSDSVSATDLVQLRRYLAGLDPLTDKATFNADLNGDGKVTTTDLVRLRRFLAGLETLIP